MLNIDKGNTAVSASNIVLTLVMVFSDIFVLMILLSFCYNGCSRFLREDCLTTCLFRDKFNRLYLSIVAYFFSKVVKVEVKGVSKKVCFFGEILLSN
jgi:hypothetical protein